jgi:hypothetical protein
MCRSIDTDEIRVIRRSLLMALACGEGQQAVCWHAEDQADSTSDLDLSAVTELDENRFSITACVFTHVRAVCSVSNTRDINYQKTS